MPLSNEELLLALDGRIQEVRDIAIETRSDTRHLRSEMDDLRRKVCGANGRDGLSSRVERVEDAAQDLEERCAACEQSRSKQAHSEVKSRRAHVAGLYLLAGNIIGAAGNLGAVLWQAYHHAPK